MQWYTGLYSAVLGYTNLAGLYRAIQGVQSYTGLYRAMKGYTGLDRAIQSYKVIYRALYHAIENTANQNAGKLFYIRHEYSTEPSHQSVPFNGITPNLPIVPCWPLYFLWHGIK